MCTLSSRIVVVEHGSNVTLTVSQMCLNQGWKENWNTLHDKWTAGLCSYFRVLTVQFKV